MTLKPLTLDEEGKYQQKLFFCIFAPEKFSKQLDRKCWALEQNAIFENIDK